LLPCFAASFVNLESEAQVETSFKVRSFLIGLILVMRKEKQAHAESSSSTNQELQKTHDMTSQEGVFGESIFTDKTRASLLCRVQYDED
jgi:hypothetical protein